jgi:hypothetical protein
MRLRASEGFARPYADPIQSSPLRLALPLQLGHSNLSGADAAPSIWSRVDKIVAVKASKFKRAPRLPKEASQRLPQEALKDHKIQ